MAKKTIFWIGGGIIVLWYYSCSKKIERGAVGGKVYADGCKMGLIDTCGFFRKTRLIKCSKNSKNR